MDKKKKMETSKKILLASYIIGITLTIIVVIGSFIGLDMGNVTTLAGAFIAEISFSNIWYYKKAQKENVPKVLASLSPSILEQVDVNQLLNS